MAVTNEDEDSEKARGIEGDCLFAWDDESKLYFHASTGFYHDPNAGWYYSSRDGLYYTFENGTYVPLTCTEEENSAARQCTGSVSSEPKQVDSWIPQHFPSDETKNEQTPSEWIEETLIDLFLSGYNHAEVNCDSLLVPLTNEEENWQAQYGQVTQLADDNLPPSSVVDLWDWEMIMETIKSNHEARLIGRLTRRTSKLHPSVPASSVLKTATIRDVHLDLVRVASGRVYRLRSPSIKYLVSLSTYDSSNPTKDWDFPDIFSSNYENTPGSHYQAYNKDGVDYARSSTTIDELPGMAEEKSSSVYRDRAAERRALHGGFGSGPGQKSFLDDNCISGALQTTDADGVPNEATNASFGPGSYARKILEGMGWKYGESLGSSNKGILEPLRPVGNKGYAGLGWNHARGEN